MSRWATASQHPRTAWISWLSFAIKFSTIQSTFSVILPLSCGYSWQALLCLAVRPYSSTYCRLASACFLRLSSQWYLRPRGLEWPRTSMIMVKAAAKNSSYTFELSWTRSWPNLLRDSCPSLPDYFWRFAIHCCFLFRLRKRTTSSCSIVHRPRCVYRCQCLFVVCERLELVVHLCAIF